MLGDARLSLKSTFSGAESTAEYRADVNLDCVSTNRIRSPAAALRLFCLTSPVSFSCGNLVPWAFVIISYERYYDQEALAEYIRNLY